MPVPLAARRRGAQPVSDRRVRSGVHVHDLAGDGAAEVAEQEHRRVGDLAVVTLRRSGVWLSSSSSMPLKSLIVRAATVAMGPADTAFTRIPSGPRSAAR